MSKGFLTTPFLFTAAWSGYIYHGTIHTYIVAHHLMVDADKQLRPKILLVILVALDQFSLSLNNEHLIKRNLCQIL